MVASATALLLAGCHCPAADDTSDADSAMSSSTMTSSSSGSGLETGVSSEAGVEGWPSAWYGDYHLAGAILGEPLLEPTIGYGWPNVMTFDDTGIRFHGFNCAGGPAESLAYEVVLHDDSLELVHPPIEGDPALPPVLGHDEVIVRPGSACGELSVEDASGERLAQWTLGQLCLTNSCDEIPSDDRYEQDLCPGAITECRW